jgi:hypothetical protein
MIADKAMIKSTLRGDHTYTSGVIWILGKHFGCGIKNHSAGFFAPAAIGAMNRSRIFCNIIIHFNTLQ